MKLYNLKLATGILIAFSLASCNQTPPPVEQPQTETPVDHTSATVSTDTITPASLDYMKAYNGKTATAVKLLEDPLLAARIKKLTGETPFEFMKQNWNTETPITVDNDILIAKACKTNECGSTESIILIDLAKNVVFAGIKEKGQVQTYSENGTINPAIMQWAATSN